MKLDTQTLRTLVKEELSKKPGAKRPTRLSEVIQASDPISDFSHGGPIGIQDALDEMKNDWMQLAEDDPSVEAVAEAAGMDPMALWEIQVDAAVEALEAKWTAAYNEVQEVLINGDYLPANIRGKF